MTLFVMYGDVSTMTIKVASIPYPKPNSKEESGIKQVITHYAKYLPKYGVELVHPDGEYDIVSAHAGVHGGNVDVAHLHGIYFTADYPAPKWEYAVNEQIVNAIRGAKVVTVPSLWVGEIMQRDFRVRPRVLSHAIEWEAWQHDGTLGTHILAYAKNRAGQDVCDPSYLETFPLSFPNLDFVATFAPDGHPPNVHVTGLLPHAEMKRVIQTAQVFISTVKETWGITIAEALASGTPVLAFNEGGAILHVKHGVNGYLARPNDYDDLAEGLAYCLTHRQILSDNARYIARRYSWDAVAEDVAGIYKAVYEGVSIERPTVSVIIPCYNKEDTIGRAIKSVLAQTRWVDEIIVVDDGSTDNSVGVIRELMDQVNHEGFTLIKQENSGVAVARNTGVDVATSKWVCCLDGDDWLDPEFIEVCVGSLEMDKELSIAYTGLTYHKPDGETGLSPWPGEWNYDEQLKRRNQIPTCCVFSREMWRRLGGYRSRYSPTGAGSEDADFWTRAGAYGFKAKQVTSRGLFHYSWMSGQVSGDPSYREVDWLAWHPWAVDKLHPIGSYATPVAGRSHPVRQYDTPKVSVVIPVIDEHLKYLPNALDSLEAQDYRRWEVVLVNDGTLPRRSWNIEGVSRFLDSYPYVRYASTGGGMGAGYARNMGVSEARAEMILFLDADDWLAKDALSSMLVEWNRHNKGVYSDYFGIAKIPNIEELAPDLQENVIDRRGEMTIIRYRASDFNAGKAMAQPENPPFIWNNVTTLIPKFWHDEIGGFDETMESWEDVLYWYKMAWLGREFVRIPRPLMYYRFHTGVRRNKGTEVWNSLLDYMQKEKTSYGM